MHFANFTIEIFFSQNLFPDVVMEDSRLYGPKRWVSQHLNRDFIEKKLILIIWKVTPIVSSLSTAQDHEHSPSRKNKINASKR